MRDDDDEPGSGRKRIYYYYKCGPKHRTAHTACSTRDIPVDIIEDFVLEKLGGYAIEPEAMREAIREANGGKDDALAHLHEERVRLESRRLQLDDQIERLLEAIESGEGYEAPETLVERLNDKQAQRYSLRAMLAETENRYLARERGVLDADTVIEGYRKLPLLIEAAQKAGTIEPLQNLLDTIIDVIEWHPDPPTGDRDKDGRSGEVYIQLRELPPVFLRQVQTSKSEGRQKGKGAKAQVPENKRSRAPVSAGSLDRQVWLRTRESSGPAKRSID